MNAGTFIGIVFIFFGVVLSWISEENYIGPILVLLVVGTFMFFISLPSVKEDDSEWIAAGCPTYTTECGKSHYACEIKVDKVGRYVINSSTIVTSHKTC